MTCTTLSVGGRSAIGVGVAIGIGIGIEREVAISHLAMKALLDRIVAMLTRLGQHGYAVREELG